MVSPTNPAQFPARTTILKIWPLFTMILLRYRNMKFSEIFKIVVRAGSCAGLVGLTILNNFCSATLPNSTSDRSNRRFGKPPILDSDPISRQRRVVARNGQCYSIRRSPIRFPAFMPKEIRKILDRSPPPPKKNLKSSILTVLAQTRPRFFDHPTRHYVLTPGHAYIFGIGVAWGTA